MKIEWVDGFEIKAVAENGEIVISANREGMLSLAKHLTALADGIPGDHIHYDVNNSLEDGSTEMIIERTDSFLLAVRALKWIQPSRIISIVWTEGVSPGTGCLRPMALRSITMNCCQGRLPTSGVVCGQVWTNYPRGRGQEVARSSQQAKLQN